MTTTGSSSQSCGSSACSFEVGDDEKPVEGPLTGQAYVITGTLESMTRNEAQAALEDARRQGVGQRVVEDDRRRSSARSRASRS